MRKLDIIFHVLGMPFDGETILTESLGGSETAAYYQARELARRGHSVKVFTTKRQPMVETDGVRYIWAGEVSREAPLGRDFEHYARHTPHDVLVIQRHPIAFQRQFASKVNLWQLHDLAQISNGQAATDMAWNVDRVTTVSAWHKKQVMQAFNFPESIIDVVPNGVDSRLYEGELDNDLLDSKVIQLKVAGKFLLLYQSRPERGLEHLVRPGGIMDRLRDTDAHLLICGYENTVPQMQAAYAQWFAWAEALPNVTRLGALSKRQLAALQQSCDLLVYPTTFEEVSCITAMEAMHAGLPMLTTDAGALLETCDNSGTLFVRNVAGAVDGEMFVATLRDLIDKKNLIGSDLTRLDELRVKQREAAVSKTWGRAVDTLEAMIEDCLRRRRGTTAAAVRHCIEHSDIELAAYLITETLDNQPEDRALDPVTERAEEELSALYAFTQTPEAYATHYAQHQGAYYDAHEAQVVGEDVTGSTRFRGTLQLLGAELSKPKFQKTKARVLDYGCAHGHYLVPLAKEFKDHEFVGIDVSARAVKAAITWCERDGVRAEFFVGGEEVLESDQLIRRKQRTLAVEWDAGAEREQVEYETLEERFDIILAGEVVEHVTDPVALLERFRAVLKPGGLIVATTPYGRWEWQGTTAFREAREHLTHFTRDDLLEVCGRNRVEIICAPAPGADHAGAALGSWCWAVRVEYPFQQLDHSRRATALAPRQTVTACLIVKDGERTLRRCIESFIDWVDEVVVCIDPHTSDRTREVLEHLQVDFRWKPIMIFEGLSPIQYGFHAARNLTLAHATSDWILWLDADEEVQQPQNLWKYLRPSMFNALGFPQVHYACDPPQVLTTDYPCRLFRHRRGIKFYGFVHEHPEEAPGKAIGCATIRHDVQFLHAGYVDETTRRRRFERNLPLLRKDLDAFPERTLNKFLWLRDIAQGMAFRIEAQGGYATEAELEQAHEGVKCFEALVERFEGNARMVLDAVQYYTYCVEVLGIGFEVDASVTLNRQPYAHLGARLNVKGKFHEAALLETLMSKLLKEGTKYYADKYL